MSKGNDRYHGVLLLDKPSGITSHDAVSKVRRIIRQRSIGHTGTLDPAAEGLLVLCLGRATKISRFLSADRKTYQAEMKLGRVSKTYDAEGVDESTPVEPIPALDEAAIENVLSGFRGEIRQQVPSYSAVHVNGKRLYEAARKGEEVEAPVRNVTIYRLGLLSHADDSIRVEVECSKGTYIRSLAHDIGQVIGCGGYLSHLQRTAAGRMDLSAALSLEQVEELHKREEFDAALLNIDRALEFGAVTISDDFSRYILHGRSPFATDVIDVEGSFDEGDRILVKHSDGSVLAVGKARLSSQHLHEHRPGEIVTYDRVLN